MRIWDINPKKLCRKHLLGEHSELHAIWSILNNHKKGYRNHPETKRWAGKNKALFARHEQLVKEMEKRNYKHNSPLDKTMAVGKSKQNKLITKKSEQKIILMQKNCECPLKAVK